MGRNYFTQEQQSELRKNAYIEKVSAKSITYTKEFKEKFGEDYRAGKLPSQILSDMGIDHRILGRKRKDSLVKNNEVLIFLLEYLNLSNRESLDLEGSSSTIVFGKALYNEERFEIRNC